MGFSEPEIVLGCIFGFPILLLCIMGICVRVIHPFMKTRAYIKGEINRSEGREYYYWKRELRKLYIEQIPILGWLIKKFK